MFESHHGTKHFLDRDEFFARTEDEQENISEWGIADKPFYRQAFERLGKIHAEGKPFFVHLLNTGTHHPYTREFTGVELPTEIFEKTKPSPEHVGYLKTLKLLDSALEEFFEAFFASPMSDDTVIMIVSDHGNSVVPAYPKLNPLQKNLLVSRIVFAVVAKNMKNPEEIDYPVNQIDMAPLIATVTGVKGQATWSGRNPLGGSGTPWVTKQGERFSYRAPKRICSKLPEEASTRCWAINKGQDPILTSDLETSEEDHVMTADFINVVEANDSLLETGDLVGEAADIGSSDAIDENNSGSSQAI